MALRKMNQQENKTVFTRSLVGLLAIVALSIGVWFGVQNAKKENVSSEKIATLSKASHAQVERSLPSLPLASEVKEVSFLLSMSLSDTEGKPFSISEKLGKLTLVNFWATWCAPCREEMPVFNAVFLQNRGKGFSVLGLTIDSSENTGKFVKQLGIEYPILMAEHEGWDLLGRTGNPKNLMPYSFLIDEKGVVLEQKLGTLHGDELQEWIDNYL